MNSPSVPPGLLASVAADFGAGSPYGSLLAVLVVLLAVAFVGRIVLAFAWRLLFVAVVAVGALYAFSAAPF